MEYENMRMPELKSLAGDCRLRNYSWVSKAELVAFFDHLDSNYYPLCRAKRPPINLNDISICGGGIKYCQWQHFTYSRKSLISWDA